MSIKIGEKIRTLRKSRNISQEILAQYLGVSFQAVSKWENGSALPDVAMIPAIASFFEVSTDELFDFNRIETERKVQQMCWDIAEYRYTEPEKAEADLRTLLKQYPGNEIILNNLLYTMRSPARNEEVVSLCKTILEITKLDDVKYDVLRILAETYKDMGEYVLCKDALNKIPEFYFTKLELDALLLDGEDSYEPACRQKDLSAETLIDMKLRIADYFEAQGNTGRARLELEMICCIINAMKDDVPNPYHPKTFYESYGKEVLNTVKLRLDAMK